MNHKLILIGMLATTLSPSVSHARDVAEDTLKGAAKGAVVGAIAGDAGKGAAAGAAGGALFGGMTKEPGKDTTAGEDVLTGAAKGAIIGGIAGDAGRKRRVDQAGGNHVDVDVEPAQLLGQRLAEGDESALGRRVVGLPLLGTPGENGGVVHDHAGAAGLHQPIFEKTLKISPLAKPVPRAPAVVICYDYASFIETYSN